MKHFLAVLLLLSVCAPRLEAQTLEDYDYENLAFQGLGLDIGGVFPNRAESAVMFGVRADLGFLGPALRVVPSIHFWSSQLENDEVERLAEQIIDVCLRQTGVSCPSQLELGEIDLNDLVLNADARYEFRTSLLATPYLGAGLGVHLLNGGGGAIDDTFVEDFLDVITPSVNVLAGVTFPLVPEFDLITEARYVLVSDVSYFGFTVGGMWSFAAPFEQPRFLRAR